MTVDDYQWIFDGIENIKNIRPYGFLLKKDRHKQQLDSFKLKTIQTTFVKNLNQNSKKFRKN